MRPIGDDLFDLDEQLFGHLSRN